MILAVGAGDLGPHRLGVLVAEVENMADLDAARRQPLAFGNRAPGLLVMHLVGGGIGRGPALDDAADLGIVGEVGVGARHRQLEIVAMTEHLALAGIGQDDEFMAEIAADRPGIGAHRDRLQPQAREGAEIGDEHPVVSRLGTLEVEVEGIGVLHQEFARSHHAEARPHLVAELPLDMIEVERQVLVRLDVGAEDLGDHLLVGRAEQHVALVAILDAQHLLAIVVVAAAFAPQLGRLDGRHQDFQRAGPVLLLAHDAADLVENALSQRQPGEAAGRLLADHAGPQHQAVRDDLGLARILFQYGQEIARKPHEQSRHEWKNAAGIGGNAGEAVCTRFIAISATIENPIRRPSRSLNTCLNFRHAAAARLCNAAYQCLLPSKFLRDISSAVRVMFCDK